MIDTQFTHRIHADLLGKTIIPSISVFCTFEVLKYLLFVYSTNLEIMRYVLVQV